MRLTGCGKRGIVAERMPAGGYLEGLGNLVGPRERGYSVGHHVAVGRLLLFCWASDNAWHTSRRESFAVGSSREEGRGGSGKEEGRGGSGDEEDHAGLGIGVSWESIRGIGSADRRGLQKDVLEEALLGGSRALAHERRLVRSALGRT